MNRMHHWLCRSDLWRKAVSDYFLPWALQGIELGDELLEIGPGPGVTTDLLRTKVARITAIEIDRALARSLSRRLAGADVRVVAGDAAKAPLANNRFTSAVSFAMLHHIPSSDLQNTVLKEVHRVLKPGCVFAGMDVLPGLATRLLHLGDTCVPVDPATFASRLQGAGFRNVSVGSNRFAFRFHAVAE